MRASVTPTRATTDGRSAPSFRNSSAAPASSSALVSSAAVRVGRGQRFVRPSPRSASFASSAGSSSTGVSPDAWSSRQNGFPLLAKWCPTAPEVIDGLIPTNTTRMPGARMSGSGRGGLER